MSHISIFEKRWIDLVFEGRNQAYGAYQLRQENPKTTMLALFYALLLLFSVSAAVMLLSSFGPKDPMPEVGVVVHLDASVAPPELVVKPKQPLVRSQATKPQQPAPQKANLDNFTIVAPDQQPEDVASAKEGSRVQAESPNEGLAGPATLGPDSGPGPEAVPDTGNTVAIAATLDRQPMFPGGIAKFYEYVGKRFNNTEIESDGARSIRIIVSFVIEKDGSLTDIVVRNNPGHDLDKEAIRVLKSLKTKWQPGLIKSQPVRTLYTLPIVVRLE